MLYSPAWLSVLWPLLIHVSHAGKDMDCVRTSLLIQSEISPMGENINF